jgi:hypothetical protein
MLAETRNGLAEARMVWLEQREVRQRQEEIGQQVRIVWEKPTTAAECLRSCKDPAQEGLIVASCGMGFLFTETASLKVGGLELSVW